MKSENLLKLYRIPCLRKLARQIILLLGADIPCEIKIGENVQLPHNSVGTVIHDKTELGDNVKIYQNVTIGRGDIWHSEAEDFEGFAIQDNAVLCAGCKILSSHGKLVVGRGTVIGANAVLTKSTGENEIWGGSGEDAPNSYRYTIRKDWRYV